MKSIQANIPILLFMLLIASAFIITIYIITPKYQITGGERAAFKINTRTGQVYQCYGSECVEIKNKK